MIVRARPQRIGPDDHGQEMTLDEFDACIGEEGFHYELIEGRIYVSSQANLPHNSWEQLILRLLLTYCDKNPDVINYVSGKARVFVPGHRRSTCPEPDLAAYANFPHHLPFSQRRWQDIDPILVVEVVSEDDPDKDFVRNVALYLEVPTIREYWILDQHVDPDRPTLTVYRRRGKRWQKPIVILAGETYETKLLPGFSLLVDPHQQT